MGEHFSQETPSRFATEEKGQANNEKEVFVGGRMVVIWKPWVVCGGLRWILDQSPPKDV